MIYVSISMISPGALKNTLAEFYQMENDYLTPPSLRPGSQFSLITPLAT